MKKAVGYLTEVFLKYFFLLESVCSDYLSRKEKWDAYKKLADIFCIEMDDTVKDYFEESEKKHFLEIKDVASYERLCRIIEFAEKSGQDVEMTEEDYLILSQKRAAVNAKADIFKHAKNLTKETISSTLQSTAMNGNIDAMALLAFMEYNGICITKDAYHALKRIRLCAKWSHTFGNLMGIAYDTTNEQYYYDVLFTVFRNENQKEIFKYICAVKQYQGTAEKDSVARIIEKAFGLDIIKRSTYDHAFSRIAFSELISPEDKEKILLSKQKDILSAFADIPFDAKKEPRISFDAECTKTVTVKRTNELSGILKNMTVTVRCPAKVYKPLYIISADDYLTEMYSDMLKSGIGKEQCVEIDASTLTTRDFLPDRDNLFLRALSGTKTTQTVFFFKNCSELEQPVMNELLKMTDYTYRNSFKLSYPAVTMNLSEIKFVFFSEKPIKELVEICDTMHSGKISQAEKKTVAETVFTERASEYGLKKLSMEESCYEYLAGFDVERLSGVIDEVIRESIFRGTDIVTAEWLKAFCSEQSSAKKEREFGFMGGARNA